MSCFRQFDDEDNIIYANVLWRFLIISRWWRQCQLHWINCWQKSRACPWSKLSSSPVCLCRSRIVGEFHRSLISCLMSSTTNTLSSPVIWCHVHRWVLLWISQCWHTVFLFITQVSFWNETDTRKILAASPLGELDETTRTPSYYLDVRRKANWHFKANHAYGNHLYKIK